MTIEYSPKEPSGSFNQDLTDSLERQQVIKELNEWLEGSKLVDAKTGEPKIFYHGTNRQFDELRHPHELNALSNSGLDHDQQGIYLTDTPENARQYADPLGSDETFTEVMAQFLEVADERSWAGAVDAWNSFQQSCIDRDGMVTIEDRNNPGQKLDLEALPQAIADGSANFTNFVYYKGKLLGQLGELQQVLGGKLPGADDTLEEYHSLFESTQRLVNGIKVGHKAVVQIPTRAKPRILPYYVKATNPLEETVYLTVAKQMDNALARDIDVALASNGAIDAVLVHSDTDGEDCGSNLVVFDPQNLRPAVGMY